METCFQNGSSMIFNMFTSYFQVSNFSMFLDVEGAKPWANWDTHPSTPQVWQRIKIFPRVWTKWDPERWNVAGLRLLGMIWSSLNHLETSFALSAFTGMVLPCGSWWNPHWRVSKMSHLDVCPSYSSREELYDLANPCVCIYYYHYHCYYRLLFLLLFLLLLFLLYCIWDIPPQLSMGYE